MYDDNSDDCEDITDNCTGCSALAKGNVRTQCTLCEKMWQATCVQNMDLGNKNQEDIDAREIHFFICCIEMALLIFLHKTFSLFSFLRMVE